MDGAIRTRCLFRVMGVEDTGFAISEKVYQDFTDPAEYAAIDTPEYTDYPSAGILGGRKYKMRPTGKFAQNIRMAAQYDTSNPEDVSFAAATPSGEMKFYCDNPRVVGTFKPQTDYYIELIPRE